MSSTDDLTTKRVPNPYFNPEAEKRLHAQLAMKPSIGTVSAAHRIGTCVRDGWFVPTPLEVMFNPQLKLGPYVADTIFCVNPERVESDKLARFYYDVIPEAPHSGTNMLDVFDEACKEHEERSAREGFLMNRYDCSPFKLIHSVCDGAANIAAEEGGVAHLYSIPPYFSDWVKHTLADVRTDSAPKLDVLLVGAAGSGYRSDPYVNAVTTVRLVQLLACLATTHLKALRERLLGSVHGEYREALMEGGSIPDKLFRQAEQHLLGTYQHIEKAPRAKAARDTTLTYALLIHLCFCAEPDSPFSYARCPLLKDATLGQHNYPLMIALSYAVGMTQGVLFTPFYSPSYIRAWLQYYSMFNANEVSADMIVAPGLRANIDQTSDHCALLDRELTIYDCIEFDLGFRPAKSWSMLDIASARDIAISCSSVLGLKSITYYATKPPTDDKLRQIGGLSEFNDLEKQAKWYYVHAPWLSKPPPSLKDYYARTPPEAFNIQTVVAELNKNASRGRKRRKK